MDLFPFFLVAYRQQGPCPVDPVIYLLNMDTPDAQDEQDETLLHGLHRIICKQFIISDLLRHSCLPFPHYIPRFEKESTGPSRTLTDVTVRSSRDGLDPDEVGGACNQRRSVGSARYARDVGWTPRLNRTVTSDDGSTPESLRPGPSSGVTSCTPNRTQGRCRTTAPWAASWP